jgi:hypothetical protein
MVLEEVDDPEEYGIGRVEITADFRDGSREIIRLGMMTPDHSRFYAMIEGDPALYLINAAMGSRLSQEIYDLVARDIPMIDYMQLTHLYVRERNRPSLEFAWDGSQEELENAVNQFGALWLTMVTPYPGRDLNFSNFETIALESFHDF